VTGGGSISAEPQILSDPSLSCDGLITDESLLEEVRQGLKRFQGKSTFLALLLFALDAAAYTTGFLCLVLLPWVWILKLPLSVLLGVSITRLAIIGHDAAHGSLSASRLTNALIGRLAFLPALHPYSLWQVGHNRIHHSFTNLKGLDFIWIPFSPEEFSKLPAWRRALERCYRSVYGFGAYYLVEIWWKYLSLKGVRVLQNRTRYLGDVALVVGFLAVQLFAALVFVHDTAALILQTVLLAIILPFAVWNWFMGFIIYNHHTNPSVRFFNKRSQWRFYEGQVKGTVHVIFPRPVGLLLNQIMEHTAHHLNINIPCYRLGAAQRFLEQRMSRDLVIEHWSLRSFFATLRLCQLYDYDRYRWVRFADAPESAFERKTQ
jgi:omega-6 fatty acid desaturase (delta-12 desaturase)